MEKETGFTRIKEIFIAIVISSLGAGLTEAALIYFRAGNYRDLFVYRSAVIYYGIFGVWVGVGLSLLWALISYLIKWKLPKRKLFWFIFVFAYSVGVYIPVRDIYLSKALKTFSTIVPFKLEIAVVGFVFAITIGNLLYAYDRKHKYNLSTPKKIIIALFILTVIPFIGGSLSNPFRPVYYIKGPSREKYRSKGPNIILIVADCLRADYLRPFGGDFPVVGLELLAKDGVVFPKAFSQCSWTRPSFASILTSCFPTQHGVRSMWTGRLSKDAVTIPSVLGSYGYYTGAFFNNVQLASEFNFNIGFDDYYYLSPREDYIPCGSADKLELVIRFRHYYRELTHFKYYPAHFYRTSEEMFDRFNEWRKETNKRPYFAIIHLMEPHEPFFRHPYDGVPHGPSYVKDADKDSILSWVDIYREEIMSMDSVINRFLVNLRKEGDYDSSIIIFTSDHGEEFYDHQSKDHGLTLYNEVIHIPLIIKLPESERAGEVNRKIVSSIDIAPTLASFIGIPIPKEWKGSNLLGKPSEDDFSAADLVNYGNRIQSIIFGDYKLIKNIASRDNKPKYELYDIAEDFGEKHNIASENVKLVAVLDSMMQIHLESKNNNPEEEVDISPSTLERLRNLGYIDK